jgi:Protein of unknown function (DUF3455)
MTNTTESDRSIASRLLSVACATTFVLASSAALPARAQELHVKPPTVPTDLQVPEGHRLFFVGHAFGTQNYICLPATTATGVAWTLFGPQANLFDDRDEQVMTHFASPNPDEKGTIRPTWQSSRDTSAVWGLAFKSVPAPGVAPAIPWLLVQVVGDEDGPTGGDRLTATKWIQRLNTTGGVAPSSGCELSTDIGKRAFVPYTADYFFYKRAGWHWDDRN